MDGRTEKQECLSESDLRGIGYHGIVGGSKVGCYNGRVTMREEIGCIYGYVFYGPLFLFA